MRKFLIPLLVLPLVLFTNFAMAWGSAGHMVIAAEAYRELSPELKAQVFEVLKAHPDFAKWQNAYPLLFIILFALLCALKIIN
jgi:hypothetical protein